MHGDISVDADLQNTNAPKNLNKHGIYPADSYSNLRPESGFVKYLS
jgi:hypothetical protein